MIARLRTNRAILIRILLSVFATGCEGTIGDAREDEASSSMPSSLSEALAEKLHAAHSQNTRRHHFVDSVEDAGIAADAEAYPDAASPLDAEGAVDAGTAVDAGAADASEPIDSGAADSGVVQQPGPPDCTVPSSWPADWVAFEDQVLALVNVERMSGATCGGAAQAPAPIFVHNLQLRIAARCHSLDMVTNNFVSHTGSDGSNFQQRISRAGYTAQARGENVAAGYPTPPAMVDGWMTSTGHCLNIMSGGSNEIGIGFAYGAGTTYGDYATQTFGAR